MLEAQVNRHKTAIRRFSYSRPVSAALGAGIIKTGVTVFDYGCGRGEDVRLLREAGIDARGWDPFHFPDGEPQPADVVNLGYVLNVIENPAERCETLRRAFALAVTCLVVAVRVDQTLENGLVYQDGLITTRGSFQKIYNQSEFREYVAQVLGIRPHVAGLGVVYAFKDEGEESRFVSGRAFQRVASYQRQAVDEFENDRVALKFVDLLRNLGRLPLPDEFPEHDHLTAKFGSRNRIERLAWRVVHPASLEEVQKLRKDELLVSLAMIRLQGSKPVPFRSLPAEVQADVKALGVNYQRSLKESETFLFAMGNADVMKKTCQECRLGKKLPDDLYVHVSLESQLPALLRLVVFAARQIVGDAECDLLKIATDGRKVSFLKYRDFDLVPHPELQYSLRVYLPKAAHSFKDYSDSTNPPILHRKETFLDELHPDYARCLNLTREEEARGLLSRPDIGQRNGWHALLMASGLKVEGYDLRETGVGPRDSL